MQACRNNLYVPHLSEQNPARDNLSRTSLQIKQVLFTALPVVVHLDVHWTGACNKQTSGTTKARSNDNGQWLAMAKKQALCEKIQSKLAQFQHKAEYSRASPLISSMALSFTPQYMHVMTAIRDTGKAWFTVVGMDSLSLKAAWKIRSRDENKIKKDSPGTACSGCYTLWPDQCLCLPEVHATSRHL